MTNGTDPVCLSFFVADDALVLSYSITILHTDAWSKHLKVHMSKELFIEQNENLKLPNDFLSGIYDRISTKQITLLNDDHPMAKLEREEKGRCQEGQTRGKRVIGR